MEDLKQLDDHVLVTGYAKYVSRHVKNKNGDDYYTSLDYFFEILRRLKRKEEYDKQIEELKNENEQLKNKLIKTKGLINNIESIQDLRKELAIKTAPNHSLLDLYRRGY